MDKRPLILAFLLAGTPLLAQTSPWPAVREFAGATPVDSPSWFKFTDYPGDLVEKDQQGNVIVAFEIGVDGRVKNCTLDTSSGFSRLDAIPCRILEKRARFKPATAADGTPIEVRGRYSVAFWQPK